MAGNSYPHIIFAKDAQVLPQQSLAEVLTGMFPGAEVEQGEIKAVLRLPDYAYTFWYDDDADGLGDRYADYAAPLRRKRVTRCTTMIDASGEADPEGAHAEDVARIMGALAQRDGVYVFSEETKRFLAMDYEDDPGALSVPPASASPAVEDTSIAEIAADTGIGEEEFVSPLEDATTPAADLQSTWSSPAHADAAVSEVVLESEDRDRENRHTEHHPVDAAVPAAPVSTPVPDTSAHAPVGGDEGRPVTGAPQDVTPSREPVVGGSSLEPRETVAERAGSHGVTPPTSPAPAVPVEPAAPTGMPRDPATPPEQKYGVAVGLWRRPAG